ncbi:MAG: 30S ribosomal protein S4 [Polyangiaceae bacterium]|nr:30S ribosomal protein S4 [Polyangiaceae bacterium]
MSRYTGPRVRVMRALGAELPGLTRKKNERRPYPPGQHGQARKKVSEYKLRLIEKQKLRMNYGVTERQLRNLMREATRAKGSPGVKLLELLERRLDNVVFRAGFARTIPAARQLIRHGFIRIAGRRVDIPSFRVVRGHAIQLIKVAKKNVHVQAALADTSIERPAWLSVDGEQGTIVVAALPERDAVLVSVDIQKVVEHYAASL